MKKEDIKQEESTLINPDLTREVPADCTVLVDNTAEINEGSETIIELPASDTSLMTDEDTNNNEISIEELRYEIDKKLEQLESSEQYKSLLATLAEYHQLLAEGRANIRSVKDRIIYANKYIKDFSEKFLEALVATDWFDKFYDAVCLYNRAHDSKESLEWCEALRDSLDESILDSENKVRKIRALFNSRINGGVFTLSVKNPYLRLKDGVFNETRPIIDIQSRSFYNWLKNIESLSLTLRNYWLELHCFSPKNATYFEDAEFHLEKVLKTPISQYVTSYIDGNIMDCSDKSFYHSILNKINLFLENIVEIELFYKSQCEENLKAVKYLTETLLDKYYKDELESIYRIYDEIIQSIDYLNEKFGQKEEAQAWCKLLDSLAETVKVFLSHQGIHCSPKLEIGKSHIDDSEFEIENRPFKFFSFAKVTSAVEAPIKELKNCVASVSKYGFYLKDSNDNIKIIRETTASVYN